MRHETLTSEDAANGKDRVSPGSRILELLDKMSLLRDELDVLVDDLRVAIENPEWWLENDPDRRIYDTLPSFREPGYGIELLRRYVPTKEKLRFVKDLSFFRRHQS